MSKWIQPLSFFYAVIGSLFFYAGIAVDYTFLTWLGIMILGFWIGVSVERSNILGWRN